MFLRNTLMYIYHPVHWLLYNILGTLKRERERETSAGLSVYRYCLRALLIV